MILATLPGKTIKIDRTNQEPPDPPEIIGFGGFLTCFCQKLDAPFLPSTVWLAPRPLVLCWVGVPRRLACSCYLLVLSALAFFRCALTDVDASSPPEDLLEIPSAICQTNGPGCFKFVELRGRTVGRKLSEK